MPSVFISYAHADATVAEQLEQALRAESIVVWRDKTSLHAGEKWPKALGEAIAAADGVVLLWSSAAPDSEFVELEWNIALAMKTPILPCLLDATPLPPALRALHAIPQSEAASLAKRLTAALASIEAPAAPNATQLVIERLAALPGGDAKSMLQTAKAAFAQQGWIVQGPVYQAAGDIHIHGEKPKKSRAERWQVWVWLAAGVLTAMTLARQLTTEPTQTPKSGEERSDESLPSSKREQQLAGIVSDERGEPLSGVRVSLPDFKRTAYTDENGYYTFSVTAPSQEQVTLIAGKDQFETHQAYATLGNTNMSFSLRRKR